MLGGNWGRYGAIALAALAAIGLLTFSYSQYREAAAVQSLIERQASNQTQIEGEAARREGQRCTEIIPTTERIDCEYRAKEGGKASRRAIRDLEAQKVMALWTRYMGLAAIIGTAVGVIGIGLVFVTFYEARKANRIARESNERQLRAYLAVDDASIGLHPEEGEIVLQIRLKNCGQTPAYKACIMGESYVAPYPLKEERPFLPVDEGWTTTIGPGLELGCAKRIFTDDVAYAVEEAKARRSALYIQGVCQYEDAFGEKRETYFRYAFAGIASEHGLLMQPAPTGNSAT